MEAEGRDWDQFEVAQLINVSLNDNRERAIDQIRWEVASKFLPRQAPFNAGQRIRVGEPYIHEEDLPIFMKAYEEGGMEGLIDSIPDSYVEGLTASGNPSEVKQRVSLYRQAGVTLPILRPAVTSQTQRLIDLFSPL